MAGEFGVVCCFGLDYKLNTIIVPSLNLNCIIRTELGSFNINIHIEHVKQVIMPLFRGLLEVLEVVRG